MFSPFVVYALAIAVALSTAAQQDEAVALVREVVRKHLDILAQRYGADGPADVGG